jgi:glycosyltransferase involved in cell wall biosynthesis
VAIESLIQGTPILISDKVGLKDWVQQHGVGEVVPLDPESWSRAIEQLEPEKLQNKENAAFLRSKAIEHFSLEAVAKSMIAEVTKILADNAAY